jgi:hypothetical protein
MVKAILLIFFMLFSLNGSESFKNVCLKCHIEKNVPNDIIYKRYLLRYSSKIKMREAMISFLKKPTVEKTIMPIRFVAIFGLKDAMILSDEELTKYIDELIENYDVKKKLTLPKDKE